jgi:hypothetical protein
MLKLSLIVSLLMLVRMPRSLIRGRVLKTRRVGQKARGEGEEEARAVRARKEATEEARTKARGPSRPFLQASVFWGTNPSSRSTANQSTTQVSFLVHSFNSFAHGYKIRDGCTPTE